MSDLVEKVREQAKEYVVDTSASLLFANAIFGTVEYLIMEPDEFIDTRLGMNLLGLVIYRPFGRFRESWAGFCRADETSTKTKKFVTDVTGNVLYFSPIYVSMMYVSGVSWEEIGTALLAGTATATLASRPYGWFLDKWRGIMGTTPTL